MKKAAALLEAAIVPALWAARLLAALLHYKKFRPKPELVQTISQELLARRAAAGGEETEALS